MTAHDTEIIRRYTGGQSTNQIARDLGLRLVDVIGRVRTLDLRPPSMSQRISPAVENPAPPVEAVASPNPEPEASPNAPGRRADMNAESAGRARGADPEDRDLDDAEDEPRRRPGCPNGWLMPEDKVTALFHPRRGRFEDAPIREKPRMQAIRPIGSLTGQEPTARAYHSLMAAE